MRALGPGLVGWGRCGGESVSPLGIKKKNNVRREVSQALGPARLTIIKTWLINLCTDVLYTLRVYAFAQLRVCLCGRHFLSLFLYFIYFCQTRV